MRSRTLVHLLRATAAAVADELPSDERERLMRASETLEVQRVEQGTSAITSEVGGLRTTQFETSRFRFHVRGDLNRNRQTGLRAANWTEAVHLWGEHLEIDALQNADSDPRLSVVDADRLGAPRRLPPYMDEAVLVTAAVCILAANVGSSAVAHLALVGSAAVATGRILNPGSVPAAATSTILGMGAGASATAVLAFVLRFEASAAAVAIATLVAATVVCSSNRRGVHRQAVLAIASLMLIAISMSEIPKVIGVLALLAVLADVLAAALIGDRRRVVLGGLAVIALAVLLTIVSATSAPTTSAVPAARLAVGATTVVIGILTSVHGVRDRLSSTMVLVTFGLAVLVLEDAALTAAAAGVSGGALLGFVGRRRPDRRPTAVPEGVSVSIRSR